MANPCAIDGDPDYSDKLVEIYQAGMRRMADRLTREDMTLNEWHQQMKDAIDKMFVFQGMAGVNGDRSRMDMGLLRQSIQKQYHFLDGFAADIEKAIQNKTSLDFVAARAAMYAGSSKQSYWQQAIDVPLPAYPGDGSTECKGYCKCDWKLECDDHGNVLATWKLGKADHCQTCVSRAEKWAPLVIPRRKAA